MSLVLLPGAAHWFEVVLNAAGCPAGSSFGLEAVFLLVAKPNTDIDYEALCIHIYG